MSSPAEDIRTRLDSLGHGTVGTDLFLSEEPTKPDACVTLYDTGGPGGEIMTAELKTRAIQVRVRNFSYATAYAKHEAIQTSLVDNTGFLIGTTNYIGVWIQSDIISLGRDDNNRYILTANYRLQRQVL